MIDTITLALSESSYNNFEPGKFTLTTSQKGVSKWVLNGTKNEREHGIHYPSLTIVDRTSKAGGINKSLQIQVSLPKMMYGNNFDELTQADFPKVLDQMKIYLARRSVEVSLDDLRRADVIGIHYGKNIALQDGTTPKMIIDKIAQGEYTRRWDVEEVKYKNNGLSWKLHTNRWELAFYDKKAELQSAKVSEARSEEKNHVGQIGLFDEPKKYKPFEVLRMEVRLNNKTMIKHVFKKIAITVPLTFEGLFAEQVAKQALLHYMAMIESARPTYFDYQSSGPDDLLAEMRISNPKMSVTNLLALAYLKQSVDQGATLGAIREIIAPQPCVQWRKLAKEATMVKVAHKDRPFAVLRSQIESYRPLKLVDFANYMLNNDKYGQY